jgi:hypothetical protein
MGKKQKAQSEGVVTEPAAPSTPPAPATGGSGSHNTP